MTTVSNELSSIAPLVLERYQQLDWLTQRHIQGRLKLCPFDTIAEELPPSGIFLDVGCGHGHFCWYLHFSKDKSDVRGIDIDKSKIDVAQSTLRGEEGPCFTLGSILDVDFDDTFSGITILDILYLIPKDLQKKIIEWSVQHLSEEGVIVLKTIDTRQQLRTRLALLQEWVMVNVFKKTSITSSSFEAQDPRVYCEWLESLGLQTTIQVLETMHPSVLISGKRHDNE